MKNLIITISAAVLLVAQSCTMKDLITPVSGNSSSDSYQPTSKGSVWTYNVQTIATNTVDIMTLSITGNTTVVGVHTYYQGVAAYASQGYSSPGYFYRNGSIYSTLAASPESGASLEMQYLDTSKPVGGTWVTNLNDPGATTNGIKAQLVGKIVENGITKVIGTKTFTNVVHTSVDMQYDLGTGNGFESMATYDYYLVKGIGFIELDASAFGIPLIKETIATYSVK